MIDGAEVIGIIGTGVMGRGVAQIAAAAGLMVLLYDQSQDAVRSAVDFVAQQFRRQADKGNLTGDEAEASIARLRAVETLQDFRHADIVFEAIAENLAVKQALFAEIEKIVPSTAIFATNTSSLSVTAIARGCEEPKRVAGFHFFNPVPLMKVVEVIPGLRTDRRVIERLCDLAARMGHRAIQVTDSPGFLVNHIGRGLSTEGLRIVQEGIASPPQIDSLVKEAGGFRMGPFQLFDLTGMDVSINVLEQIYGQFHQEPRYRPSYLARRQVDAGLFGRKTGRGWYRYDDPATEGSVTDQNPPVLPCPVWIDPSDSSANQWLSGIVEDAGWQIDSGTAPAPKSLCLIAPIGADATTTSVRLGLDPTRTVAVDCLTRTGRLTAMTTSVTDLSYRAATLQLLSKTMPATVIYDSPGFVLQRIVAAIVNVACDIAQQRIASPDDIDAGARLGLGYPSGPLELGDRWGAGVILKILEEIHAFYGDPRYRPSPWLKRRALLGVSLKTAEA